MTATLSAHVSQIIKVSIYLQCPYFPSAVEVVERRVSRKYSLGSSMDLVRPISWDQTASHTDVTHNSHTFYDK